VIVPFMLAPKAKELVGISNLTAVFGFLNLLKKPKDLYLRFDAIPKNKESIYDLCVFLQKENTRFLGAKNLSKLVILRLIEALHDKVNVFLRSSLFS